jgi:hypothetical protein
LKRHVQPTLNIKPSGSWAASLTEECLEMKLCTVGEAVPQDDELSGI